MSKTVINKFPVNKGEGELYGIGNADISNTSSKVNIDNTMVDLSCSSAETTVDFIIQISLITYPNWGNGSRLIGDYSAPSDSNDFRLFWTNNRVYYDFGSARLNKSFTSYYGKVCNLEMGNYYLKDLDTGTNIYSGRKNTNLSNVQAYMGRLRLFGEGDVGIVNWVKVYPDGQTLKYWLVPDQDGTGYGFRDKVSGNMIYRPSNNRQVYMSQINTQVQDLFWNNTLINKAYVGSDCIWATIATVPAELYAVNIQNPNPDSRGNKIYADISTESYGSTTMTSWKIQTKIYGFRVGGGLLIGQDGKYNRFFATAGDALYFDYAYNRLTVSYPDNFYSQPMEIEFGQEKTLTTNRMYIKNL